jgi:hypothetical protein
MNLKNIINRNFYFNLNESILLKLNEHKKIISKIKDSFLK